MLVTLAPGLQEQSGLTSLVWLPGQLGGRLGLCCSHLAVAAGLTPGSAVQGPKVLLRLSPAALLLPLDRGFTWLAAGSPDLIASCLKWKGALMSTDSCSVALEPRRVWASGRPVGAEPEEINIRTGLWARLLTPGGGEQSLRGLSRWPRNEQPWLIITP